MVYLVILKQHIDSGIPACDYVATLSDAFTTKKSAKEYVETHKNEIDEDCVFDIEPYYE